MNKTWKKLLALLLCLVLTGSLLPAAFAEGEDEPAPNAAEVIASGSCGENCAWNLDSNGLLIVSGTGSIPDYSGSNAVPWADYRDKIYRLKVTDGVTAVGNKAFIRCTALTELNLAATVTTLGSSSFSGCSALASVTLPEGLEVIRAYAFSNCGALSWIRLPKSLRTVADDSFLNSSSLQDVYYAGSEEEWQQVIVGARNPELMNAAMHYNGFPVFGVCGRSYQGKNLTWILNEEGELRISGTGQMEHFAFGAEQPWLDYLDQIRSLVIEPGATSIGYYAFQNCVNLRSVSLPNTLSSILDNAFLNCSSLTAIDIPKSVTVLSLAFMDCSSLRSLVIPEGITSITSRFFEGCTSLQTVTIPQSVTEIRYNAFPDYGCLTDIYYTGTEEQWNALSIYPGNNGLEAGTVHYGYVEKPVVLTQPESVKVREGENAVFSVTVYGQDLQYQWYYKAKPSDNWTAVKNNGTSATYTLTAAERHNGYQYRCRAKNSAGQTFSQLATLTVDLKPLITASPASVTVGVGDKASFTVAADGRELQYQWYYKTKPSDSWTAVKNNGTSSTYTLTTAARHNGYQYRCRVKNSAGQVFSEAVTLTVTTRPVITGQPENVTVALGDKASFTVTAVGRDLQYQWYYKAKPSDSWTAVKNNGTSSTYTLTTAARHNGYQYRCRVKNSETQVFTAAVTLTVASAPLITGQTGSVYAQPGNKVSFTVTAVGKDLQYQWYYKTELFSDDWKPVSAPSGKTATYTLTAAARHNGYFYRCLVKNTYGEVWSDEIPLTVYDE